MRADGRYLKSGEIERVANMLERIVLLEWFDEKRDDARLMSASLAVLRLILLTQLLAVVFLCIWLVYHHRSDSVVDTAIAASLFYVFSFASAWMEWRAGAKEKWKNHLLVLTVISVGMFA
jgi:hypothetical protein